jgi:hypothetical protein
MSDDGGFVVEPAQGLEIQIAVGSDAELTPELRAALDDLVRVLEEQPEVEVYRNSCGAKCRAPNYGVCNPEGGTCAPKIWFPCASKLVCSIIDTELA